jgi:peptide/nickel transport system substrate-binding protein
VTHKFTWLSLLSLIIAAILLVSCSTSSTTPSKTSTSTPISPTTTQTSKPTQTQVTTSTPVTKPTTTTSPAGTPQYGGFLNFRIDKDYGVWDTFYSGLGASGSTAAQTLGLFYGQMTMFDLSVDRNVNDFKTGFNPIADYAGNLVESWDIAPDWTSYTFHIRKAAVWQDIPPMNGRAVNASDIAWNWNRNLGLAGFPPNALFPKSNYADITSVTATDQNTVVFQNRIPTSNMFRALIDLASYNFMMPPDAVKQWGDVNDWHHVIGTGPYLLNDYVRGSSITAVRNPNFYLYDYKYPKNKLPYPDGIRVLVIPDPATALAGLRTGKIDLVQNVTSDVAASLKKTNPDLLFVTRPDLGECMMMMIPKKPFSDINVRKALQMAVDLPTIAKTHYGGYVDGLPTGCVAIQGYNAPYAEWPQDVKDSYAYNPDGAKKLLAAAGYPQGFKTTFAISSNSDVEMYQIVKSYFAAIGVDMQINVMDPATFAAYITTGQQEMSQYVGWAGTTPPLNSLYNYWSKQAKRNSYNHILDPVYDAMVDKANADLDDKSAMADIKAADLYGIKMQYSVMLGKKVALDFYTPWFHGYQGETQYQTSLAPYMWIDQKLKKSMGN